MTKKNLTELILDIAIVVFVVIGTIFSGNGQGTGMLLFYTVLSNLGMGVVTLICIVYLCRKMISGQEIPHWVRTARYMATCCVVLTFFIASAVLSFSFPGGLATALTRGAFLYLHLFVPVLSVLVYLMNFGAPYGIWKSAAVAMIPTVLYAVVLVILNLLRVVTGPYPFLRVYEQPVGISCLWFALILSIAYGIALLIAAVRKTK